METFEGGIEMIKNKIKIHKAAGIVPYLIDEDGLKFLLIKNNLGWEFPKGHIEGVETDLQAAKREMKEETGLTSFTVDPRFKYISKYFLNKNYETGEKLDIPQPKTVTYFLAKTFNIQKISLSFEHHSYGWFTPEEANKKLYFSKKREVLVKAINFIQA